MQSKLPQKKRRQETTTSVPIAAKNVWIAQGGFFNRMADRISFVIQDTIDRRRMSILVAVMALFGELCSLFASASSREGVQR